MDSSDPRSIVDRRTPRRRAGDAAEATAAGILRQQGWTIFARQLRIGRDELDLVALDPGPPAMMVAVEVRSRSSPRFGPQEERVDEAKVRRLYRAMNALRVVGRLPDGRPLPVDIGWRVDLLAVERRRLGVRHLKGLIPR